MSWDRVRGHMIVSVHLLGLLRQLRRLVHALRVDVEADASQIQAYANLLKENTCVPDGFHPRHYLLLGTGALQAMAGIIALMLLVGQAPAQIRALQVMMQNKHKGPGRRPN